MKTMYLGYSRGLVYGFPLLLFIPYWSFAVRVFVCFRLFSKGCQYANDPVFLK